MSKFQLTTKSGEVIATIKASEMDEAVEMFSQMKDLSIEYLLEIFIIKQEK